MITSLISMKGGTAKTTTAVNLAAYLALGGLKVLLIDLDPQNFATLCLGVDTDAVKCSMADILLDERPMQDAIYSTHVPNLDLVPADRRLASTDVLLADVPGREKILKTKADKILSWYDHILIDNPPSLNLLTINALMASDNFVITVSPSFLSLVGLRSLLETVEVIKKNMHSKVELLGILPTMADLRMKITSEIIDVLRDHFKEKVFKTVIRHNVKLLEAPSHGKTIFEYDSGSMGALCYIYFGKEFLSRCQN
jgi:chromosome partitioning protein